MAQLGRRVKQTVLWTVCSQSPRDFTSRAEEPRALPTSAYEKIAVGFQIQYKRYVGGMAQLVERRVRNAEATSSNLVISTKLKSTDRETPRPYFFFVPQRQEIFS